VPEPDLIAALRALVEAHPTPDPNTGDREPIYYFIHSGGGTLQHHALADPGPKVDQALLEEMHLEGVLDIDYREHTWALTPTPQGRRLIEQHDRVEDREPVAEVEPIAEALVAQSVSANKLAWPAVRPVLAAIRAYWEAGGFSPYGVQVPALLEALPEEHLGLFGVTIRRLVEAGYLNETPGLSANGIPAEVSITERAHTVLDGWPGAPPDELVQNLLAVLTAAIAEESDPARKTRLQRLAGTIREVGVDAAGEILVKVLMGGI
jgi:hypothetical protein